MSRRKFENDTPIDDQMVVLDLLCRRWGDNTTREIIRWFPERGPYVEIGHHHDFSDSTCYRFRVTDRVVDALLAIGFAMGKPKWGYTEMHELTATEFGERHLWSERKRLEMQDRLRSDWWFQGRLGYE